MCGAVAIASYDDARGSINQGGDRVRRAPEVVGVSADASEDATEEFDPIGTIVLLAIYFLILVAMWSFMYFVEFLGNGPTITG
jgi:hypothetical protein